jgi:uncharacterized membrane protein YdjX (TVP38/TMEM64 family)
MIELLKKAYAWGPLLFGVGFVAPVIAQTLDATSVAPPLGLTTVQTGLVTGVLLGTVAKLRGRWI